MSWRDIACLCVVILGIVLFLYGSNYYNAVVGWAGIFLIIGGFLAGVLLQAYEMLRKKEIV